MNEHVFESPVERDIFQFFGGSPAEGSVATPPKEAAKSVARLSEETMTRIKRLIDKLDAATPQPAEANQEAPAQSSTIEKDVANFFSDGWDVPADQNADFADK